MLHTAEHPYNEVFGNGWTIRGKYHMETSLTGVNSLIMEGALSTPIRSDDLYAGWTLSDQQNHEEIWFGAQSPIKVRDENRYVIKDHSWSLTTEKQDQALSWTAVREQRSSLKLKMMDEDLTVSFHVKGSETGQESKSKEISLMTRQNAQRRLSEVGEKDAVQDREQNQNNASDSIMNENASDGLTNQDEIPNVKNSETSNKTPLQIQIKASGRKQEEQLAVALVMQQNNTASDMIEVARKAQTDAQEMLDQINSAEALISKGSESEISKALEILKKQKDMLADTKVKQPTSKQEKQALMINKLLRQKFSNDATDENQSTDPVITAVEEKPTEESVFPQDPEEISRQQELYKNQKTSTIEDEQVAEKCGCMAKDTIYDTVCKNQTLETCQYEICFWGPKENAKCEKELEAAFEFKNTEEQMTEEEIQIEIENAQAEQMGEDELERIRQVLRKEKIENRTKDDKVEMPEKVEDKDAFDSMKDMFFQGEKEESVGTVEETAGDSVQDLQELQELKELYRAAQMRKVENLKEELTDDEESPLDKMKEMFNNQEKNEEKTVVVEISETDDKESASETNDTESASETNETTNAPEINDEDKAIESLADLQKLFPEFTTKTEDKIPEDLVPQKTEKVDDVLTDLDSFIPKADKSITFDQMKDMFFNKGSEKEEPKKVEEKIVKKEIEQEEPKKVEEKIDSLIDLKAKVKLTIDEVAKELLERAKDQTAKETKVEVADKKQKNGETQEEQSEQTLDLLKSWLIDDQPAKPSSEKITKPDTALVKLPLEQQLIKALEQNRISEKAHQETIAMLAGVMESEQTSTLERKRILAELETAKAEFAILEEERIRLETEKEAQIKLVEEWKVKFGKQLIIKLGLTKELNEKKSTIADLTANIGEITDTCIELRQEKEEQIARLQATVQNVTMQAARHREAKENVIRESAYQSGIINEWISKYKVDMSKVETEKGQKTQVNEWTLQYGFKLMDDLFKSKDNQTQVVDEWIASRDNSTNTTAMLSNIMENLTSKTKNQELMIKQLKNSLSLQKNLTSEQRVQKEERQQQLMEQELLLSEYKEKLQIAAQNVEKGKLSAAMKLLQQEKLVLEYVAKEKDALDKVEKERQAKQAIMDLRQKEGKKVTELMEAQRNASMKLEEERKQKENFANQTMTLEQKLKVISDQLAVDRLSFKEEEKQRLEILQKQREKIREEVREEEKGLREKAKLKMQKVIAQWEQDKKINENDRDTASQKTAQQKAILAEMDERIRQEKKWNKRTEKENKRLRKEKDELKVVKDLELQKLRDAKAKLEQQVKFLSAKKRAESMDQTPCCENVTMAELAKDHSKLENAWEKAADDSQVVSRPTAPGENKAFVVPTPSRTEEEQMNLMIERKYMEVDFTMTLVAVLGGICLFGCVIFCIFRFCCLVKGGDDDEEADNERRSVQQSKPDAAKSPAKQVKQVPALMSKPPKQTDKGYLLTQNSDAPSAPPTQHADEDAGDVVLCSSESELPVPPTDLKMKPADHSKAQRSPPNQNIKQMHFRYESDHEQAPESDRAMFAQRMPAPTDITIGSDADITPDQHHKILPQKSTDENRASANHVFEDDVVRKSATKGDFKQRN